MTLEKKISLRPVRDEDEDFLFSVYASSRADEMALVPWTVEQQHAFLRMQLEVQTRHYAAQHPLAIHQIICADELPAGRIYFDNSGPKLHILDITVLISHRRQGIGSTILHRIMADASEAKKPVTIYVESFNRSLHLFQRLGFQQADESGFCLLMEKNPTPASE